MIGRVLGTGWHYTCDHGRACLGDIGTLLPMAQHTPEAVDRAPATYRWLLELVWVTDLDAPDVAALGLTKHTLDCDRSRHRYRVLDSSGLMWWPQWAKAFLAASERAFVERQPGSLPAHWWVAVGAVPVMYDPQVAKVRQP